MTSELKPCPFCGGEAAPMYPGARSFEICCMVCNAETDVYGSVDEAATAWNKRAERTCEGCRHDLPLDRDVCLMCARGTSDRYEPKVVE